MDKNYNQKDMLSQSRGVLKLCWQTVIIGKPVVTCLLLVLCFNTSCSTILGTYSESNGRSTKQINYTVKSGDTLSAIASRYRTTPAQIVKLNSLRNSSKIYVGQVLRIKVGVQNTTPRQAMKVEASRMIWPVQGGGTLTSKFGRRKSGFHDGIDIAAKTGTPVLAAHDGRVIYANNKLRGYGNLIILRGSGSIKTVYGHNDRLLVGLEQRVRKGQKIAEVGSTGKSTGPHLHFEIRTLDNRGRHIAVDPLPILTRSNKKADYRVNNNITAIIVADDKKHR
ncbi:MAG: M23 family metallopeptidase [Deltaproteobacteria bacterium]|jgi:murein DD-endopeptidase MepM/ murein hydrolase activator NlpD|nr:M23 family metallopeptidase [Deltaproteobacteria bacterium]